MQVRLWRSGFGKGLATVPSEADNKQKAHKSNKKMLHDFTANNLDI